MHVVDRVACQNAPRECFLDTLVDRLDKFFWNGSLRYLILEYVASAGLNLGVSLRVVARNLSSESVRLKVGPANESLTLGLGAAAKVLVREG